MILMVIVMTVIISFLKIMMIVNYFALETIIKFKTEHIRHINSNNG